MSAERKPQAELSPFSQPFAYLTRLVLRFPVITALLAIAAALAAVGFSASRLSYRTSRLDLISANAAYNRLWLDYIQEFGSDDDVVVVVEGTGKEQVIPALQELGAALVRQDRLYHAVLHRIDLSHLRSKGLYYLTVNELQDIERYLNQVEPILRDWSRLSLGHMLGGMCIPPGMPLPMPGADPRQANPPLAGSAAMSAAGSQRPDLSASQLAALQAAAQAQLASFADGLSAALADPNRYVSPWPEMKLSEPAGPMAGALGQSEYLLANEGRLGFILLRIAKDDKSDFVQGTEAIDSLRRLLAEMQAKHAGTKIGLTGLPVMENDEMRASQNSMTESNILSMLGVAFLFVAGFGGLRHPLIGCTSLMLGMAWSLGYTTLAVGHLNILSVAFAAMLIGLGDDFSIHYVARYLQLRSAGRGVDQALMDTAAGVGPGTLTGAMTTAVAFFMAGLSDFTGVAELGIIAGGGILLCCLAAMTVLPAMIHISDVKWPSRLLPSPLDIPAWLMPLMRHPGLVVSVTLLGTGALSLGIGQLWYDHNLLNLQAEGIESVELERKVLHQSEHSVWFALSVADSRDELLDRKKKYGELIRQKSSTIDRVEEIASVLVDDEAAKQSIISRIGAHLQELPEQAPSIPVDAPASLNQSLAALQRILAMNPQASQAAASWGQIRQALARLPSTECCQRIAAFQQRAAAELLGRLQALRSAANPIPPRLGDLPEGLVTRFVGRNGRHLLRIYSKVDIWDMDKMEKFVAEVRSVDPRATGNPLQTYEASLQMKRSYEQAGWYALAGILVVIFLDFRSISYTLLSMVPLGLGMLQMFGLLGLLGIPLNPANMISVPLILGIGVENGVHVIHDFHVQKGRYRISASTAFAVVLTTLTTMVGFASLMIASHRGLQSLGRVLTIGMSCCLFSSLIILPALLAWMTSHRSAGPPSDAEPTRRTQPHTHFGAQIYRRESSQDAEIRPPRFLHEAVTRESS